jgi:hypothetical protein
VFSLFQQPSGPASATPFWLTLTRQARIQPVIADGRCECVMVRLPYWRFSVRRHLRHGQARYAFLHMIDERIRAELTVAEDHPVPRKLVGRWGTTIMTWHEVTDRHA